MPTTARILTAMFPLLLVIGCGEDKAATKTSADEIFPVQVVRVQQENLLRTLSAVGTIRYRRETPLGFTTPGKVAIVRFEEGDFVKRGALLAALDTTSVRADVSVDQLSVIARKVN